MGRTLRGLAVVGLLAGAVGISASARAQGPAEDLDDLNYSPIIVYVAGADLFGADGAQVVSGQSWVVGDEVEFFLNNEYVATDIATPNAEGSATPWFDLTDLEVMVEAGDEVRLALADGTRTEVHEVSGLSPGAVSAWKDTVAGTAAPGSVIVLGVFDESGLAARSEIADTMGNWLADFARPGDQVGEEATFDIVPSSLGLAAQFDVDGSATIFVFAPTVTSKDQCKNGGWEDFGIFSNQGECVRLAPRA